MERGVLTGLTAFRWVAWAWMATVTTLARDRLERPWLAILLVGLALAVTAWCTATFRRDPSALLRPGPILAEVALGIALQIGDGLAYHTGHVLSTEQSLGVAWPLFGVLSAGLAGGGRAGALAGVVVGLSRFGGTLVNGVDLQTVLDEGGRVASHATTIVIYSVAGSMIGYMGGLLRRAEREISQARAREEVARRLHDGVLQTLAVVERRTDDPALARLAREQERDLREWLFGAGIAGRANAEGLGPALRAAAARFEDVYGGHVTVVVADDLAELAPERVEAIGGAVGEALTNAGKHGDAQQITVYAEPDDDGGVFCSVKDDGTGFDPAHTTEGVGLRRSIRGRMEESGGRVEVASRPGHGTEVRLWLPS
jgi:signal transduction histidine kinase